MSKGSRASTEPGSSRQSLLMSCWASPTARAKHIMLEEKACVLDHGRPECSEGGWQPRDRQLGLVARIFMAIPWPLRMPCLLVGALEAEASACSLGAPARLRCPSSLPSWRGQAGSASSMCHLCTPSLRCSSSSRARLSLHGSFATVSSHATATQRRARHVTHLAATHWARRRECAQVGKWHPLPHVLQYLQPWGLMHLLVDWTELNWTEATGGVRVLL